MIDRSYLAILDSIGIWGIVNGNVYAAGTSVLVDGQIIGKLFAAGEKLPSSEYFPGKLTFIFLLSFLGTIVTFLAIRFHLEVLLMTKKEVYIAARDQRMI